MQTATSSIPSPTISLSSQRYSSDQLAEFRTIVAAKLEATRESMKALEETLLLDKGTGTNDTYRPSNVMEDGQETLEREEAATMVGRLRRYENDLMNAWRRLEQGTFGICRVTGKRIPAERLKAVPTTMVCIEHK